MSDEQHDVPVKRPHREVTLEITQILQELDERERSVVVTEETAYHISEQFDALENEDIELTDTDSSVATQQGESVQKKYGRASAK